jgi:type IV pilus assembly protein PilW
MVELIVAMVLGLFLLLALVEILVNGKSSFGSATHLSRLQENGRIATNLIVTDLKRAGYMGGNSNPANIGGTAGQVIPTTVNCPPLNNSWGRQITQPVFGKNDRRGGYGCIPAEDWLRGDILVTRHAAPWLATGALNPNQMYLRSSLFEGRIFLGSAEGVIPENSVEDTPESVRELQSHAYFVGPSGRNCGANPVPSLFRVDLDVNGLPRTQELLPGIEHFQVQYGLSTNNGVTAQYLDADALTLTDWADVATVRIWLLVRAECSETGFADNTTYTMGDVVYTPNDNFRRQLYSSVVMIRN